MAAVISPRVNTYRAQYAATLRDLRTAQEAHKSHGTDETYEAVVQLWQRADDAYGRTRRAWLETNPVLQARRRLHLTREAMAQHCGISYSALQQWERGGVNRLSKSLVASFIANTHEGDIAERYYSWLDYRVEQAHGETYPEK